jgi:hypothetical protein
VPLFLLLFAWAYFTMAASHPASFSTRPLTGTGRRWQVAVGLRTMHGLTRPPARLKYATLGNMNKRYATAREVADDQGVSPATLPRWHTRAW